MVKGIRRLKEGKAPSPFLLRLMMGAEQSVTEMFYKNVSLQSVKNACRTLYTHRISPALSGFHGRVLMMAGEREKFSVSAIRSLAPFLPQAHIDLIPRSGHGEFLHRHPKEYAQKLREFLE